MDDQPALRIRIVFAKTEAMRYTGHLDLHTAWERAFRRAALPLAYSHGYNPRPKLNLASALPLGFTSQFEVLDVWLEQDLPLEDIHASLEAALPPGIKVLQLHQVDLREPALQTQVEAAEYTVTLLEPLNDLDRRCRDLMATSRIERVRRGKPYDLRPLILDLLPLVGNGNGAQRFVLRLAVREGATGRPEEVISALGAGPEAARVVRTRLLLKDTKT